MSDITSVLKNPKDRKLDISIKFYGGSTAGWVTEHAEKFDPKDGFCNLISKLDEMNEKIKKSSSFYKQTMHTFVEDYSENIARNPCSWMKMVEEDLKKSPEWKKDYFKWLLDAINALI